MNAWANIWWTVYRSPPAFPGWYVARNFGVRPHAPKAVPGEQSLVARDLDAVRAMLPPGLHRMPRAEGDEREIVETWL